MELSSRFVLVILIFELCLSVYSQHLQILEKPELIIIQSNKKPTVQKESESAFVTDEHESTWPIPQTKVRVKVREVKSIGKKATRFEVPVVNSTVILNKGIKRLELICTSSQPIKWEFLVNDVPIPILEVEYKRIFTPKTNASVYEDSELRQAALNSFEGRISLRGLLESQSGKYVCYSKLDKNSYKESANLSVFIPGKRGFTSISQIKYINKTDTSLIVIPCTVSNPQLQVLLFKLNEEIFNRTSVINWDPISSQYIPQTGFILEHSQSSHLFGTYRCIIPSTPLRNEKSVTIHLADAATKESLYDPLLMMNNSSLTSCWESPSCVKIMRSRRLECFCKDSLALFAKDNNNYYGSGNEDENRRGNCSSLNTGLEEFSSLTNGDWRVQEFFRNAEDNSNLCFRDGIRENLNGTGTRAILRTTKMELVGSLVNLTVTYDGFPNWASGFKIGIEYSQTIGEEKTHSIFILNREPSISQFYPLAHQSAIWTNVIVDAKDVIRIHIFQPDSFSFEWFQVSSTVAAATVSNGSTDVVGVPQTDSSSNGLFIPLIISLVVGLLVCVLVAMLVMFYIRKRSTDYYRCDKITLENPNYEYN